MIRIRQATAADIPAIRALAHAAWPVAYGAILSPEQLAYMLELMYNEAALLRQMDEGSVFLLAELDGTIIGFSSHSVHHNGKAVTRLHKLYLHPERKGTGVGRLLLHAVEEAGRAAGDAVLNLNVNRFNPSAGFYRHLGFQVVREEVLDIGAGYVMDDHVMERPIA